MNLLTVAAIVVAALLFAAYALHRAEKCTNHCWGEWEANFWNDDPLEMKLVRMRGSGSKYLKVKKERKCTHQGCRATQERYCRVKKYHSTHNLPNVIRREI